MTLSLTLDSSGVILEAQVLNSSAPQNLEEAVLKVLRNDISYPPIPQELGMPDSSLVVTLIFRRN